MPIGHAVHSKAAHTVIVDAVTRAVLALFLGCVVIDMCSTRQQYTEQQTILQRARLTATVVP